MSLTFTGKNASEWRSDLFNPFVGTCGLWLVGCFTVFLFVCFALNQHNECMHTTEKPGVKDVSEPNSGSILNRKGKPP